MFSCQARFFFSSKFNQLFKSTFNSITLAPLENSSNLAHLVESGIFPNSKKPFRQAYIDTCLEMRKSRGYIHLPKLNGVHDPSLNLLFRNRPKDIFKTFLQPFSVKIPSNPSAEAALVYDMSFDWAQKISPFCPIYDNGLQENLVANNLSKESYLFPYHFAHYVTHHQTPDYFPENHKFSKFLSTLFANSHFFNSFVQNIWTDTTVSKEMTHYLKNSLNKIFGTTVNVYSNMTLYQKIMQDINIPDLESFQNVVNQNGSIWVDQLDATKSEQLASSISKTFQNFVFTPMFGTKTPDESQLAAWDERKLIAPKYARDIPDNVRRALVDVIFQPHENLFLQNSFFESGVNAYLNTLSWAFPSVVTALSYEGEHLAPLLEKIAFFQRTPFPDYSQKQDLTNSYLDPFWLHSSPEWNFLSFDEPNTLIDRANTLFSALENNDSNHVNQLVHPITNGVPDVTFFLKNFGKKHPTIPTIFKNYFKAATNIDIREPWTPITYNQSARDVHIEQVDDIDPESHYQKGFEHLSVDSILRAESESDLPETTSLPYTENPEPTDEQPFQSTSLQTLVPRYEHIDLNPLQAQEFKLAQHPMTQLQNFHNYLKLGTVLEWWPNVNSSEAIYHLLAPYFDHFPLQTDATAIFDTIPTVPLEKETLEYLETLPDDELYKSISKQVVNHPQVTDLFRAPFIRKGKTRKIIFHHGPTNASKTYSALQLLKNHVENMKPHNHTKVIYIGPLRMLAAEIQDTLQNSYSIPTQLVTGDGIVKPKDNKTPTVLSTTCFYAQNLLKGKKYEFAVVDEIQMVSDRRQGHFFTNVLLNLNADTIVLTGSSTAVELVEQICQHTGDDLELINFTPHSDFPKLVPPLLDHTVDENDTGSSRKKGIGCINPEHESIWLSKLEKGDCLIAFNKAQIQQISSLIKEKTKFGVSVVHGGLPINIRRLEAKKFNSGETDILVASNAIAMGLNLLIKRIIFTSTSIREQGSRKPTRLSPPDVFQIAGRAGRKGSMFQGLGQATSIRKKTHAELVTALSSPLPTLSHAYYHPGNDLLQFKDTIETIRQDHPNVPFGDLVRDLYNVLASKTIQDAPIPVVLSPHTFTSLSHLNRLTHLKLPTIKMLRLSVFQKVHNTSGLESIILYRLAEMYRNKKYSKFQCSLNHLGLSPNVFNALEEIGKLKLDAKQTEIYKEMVSQVYHGLKSLQHLLRLRIFPTTVENVDSRLHQMNTLWVNLTNKKHRK